jgi:hypothetical protein
MYGSSRKISFSKFAFASFWERCANQVIRKRLSKSDIGKFCLLTRLSDSKR